MVTLRPSGLLSDCVSVCTRVTSVYPGWHILLFVSPPCATSYFACMEETRNGPFLSVFGMEYTPSNLLGVTKIITIFCMLHLGVEIVWRLIAP
jgi:hypothetical protein